MTRQIATIRISQRESFLLFRGSSIKLIKHHSILNYYTLLKPLNIHYTISGKHCLLPSARRSLNTPNKSDKMVSLFKYRSDVPLAVLSRFGHPRFPLTKKAVYFRELLFSQNRQCPISPGNRKEKASFNFYLLPAAAFPFFLRSILFLLFLDVLAAVQQVENLPSLSHFPLRLKPRKLFEPKAA